MKQKFDLETWLKNKSRKVVTDDGRTARIIATDVKTAYGNPDRILALVPTDTGHENALFYTADGYCLSDSTGKRHKDLFFADDEPELSEFEQKVKEIADCKENCSYAGDSIYKSMARELLTIARKQLEKDLPKWKKTNINGTGVYEIIGQVPMALYHNGYMIELTDLEKLPKED